MPKCSENVKVVCSGNIVASQLAESITHFVLALINQKICHLQLCWQRLRGTNGLTRLVMVSNPTFISSKSIKIIMNSNNRSGMLQGSWLPFFAAHGSSVHDFFQCYPDHQQDEEHPESNSNLSTNVTHRHEIPQENSARKSMEILWNHLHGETGIFDGDPQGQRPCRKMLTLHPKDSVE